MTITVSNFAMSYCLGMGGLRILPGRSLIGLKKSRCLRTVPWGTFEIKEHYQIVKHIPVSLI